MKKYLNQPEILILFVYAFCFSTGIISLMTGVSANHFLDQLPDICIFKIITGYKCPGCGMTHAFICLGKFQIREALQHNIFSVFLFYGGLLWLITGNRFQIKLGKAILILLLALILSYGIARNAHWIL